MNKENYGKTLELLKDMQISLEATRGDVEFQEFQDYVAQIGAYKRELNELLNEY